MEIPSMSIVNLREATATSPSEPSTARLCEVCNLHPSKYVCPRCGIPYCSLPCYKDERKHSQCSETFYREWVMEDLKSQEKDPASAVKMKEALQRFHEEYGQEDPLDDDEGDEALDSDDDDPLANRLEGIDLNDTERVWEQLTEEERNEFKKFVKNVEVDKVVPIWEPWWTKEHLELKLVQEVNEGEEGADESTPMVQKAHEAQPDILDKIPAMSTLTRVRPSETVKRGLTNVVASYVWVSRLYNGEFLTYENAGEVAGALITLSSFLHKDMVFTNYQHAVTDVPMNACQVPELFDGGPSLHATLNQDVHQILRGPPLKTLPSASAHRMQNTYILSALTECYKLIRKVSSAKPTSTMSSDDTEPQSSFQSSFKPSNSVLIDAKLLSKTKRKLYYLLAFANEFDVL